MNREMENGCIGNHRGSVREQFFEETEFGRNAEYKCGRLEVNDSIFDILSRKNQILNIRSVSVNEKIDIYSTV